MNRNTEKQIITWSFVLTELCLYILILTTGGMLLVVSSYASIILCFLFALTNARKNNWLISAALACTVGADFFLVVCSPIRQLEGMIFFMAAQSLYAVKLHQTGSKNLLFVRGVALLCAVAVVFPVLKEKTDALAIISLCYYANLLVNIIAAFARFRENKLLSFAFVLFALCDTVIGLQAARGVYLPIGEDSLIYRIIFMDFNLAWFFYLPSQVLIAMSCRKTDSSSL